MVRLQAISDGNSFHPVGIAMVFDLVKIQFFQQYKTTGKPPGSSLENALMRSRTVGYVFSAKRNFSNTNRLSGSCPGKFLQLTTTFG